MGGAFKPIELAVNPTVSLLIKPSQTNWRLSANQIHHEELK
jgi:hypothetical protein